MLFFVAEVQAEIPIQTQIEQLGNNFSAYVRALNAACINVGLGDAPMAGNSINNINRYYEQERSMIVYLVSTVEQIELSIAEDLRQEKLPVEEARVIWSTLTRLANDVVNINRPKVISGPWVWSEKFWSHQLIITSLKDFVKIKTFEEVLARADSPTETKKDRERVKAQEDLNKRPREFIKSLFHSEPDALVLGLQLLIENPLIKIEAEELRKIGALLFDEFPSPIATRIYSSVTQLLTASIVNSETCDFLMQTVVESKPGRRLDVLAIVLQQLKFHTKISTQLAGQLIKSLRSGSGEELDLAIRLEAALSRPGCREILIETTKPN